MKIIYAFIFVITLVGASPKSDYYDEPAQSTHERFDDLSLKEWKKFKHFESQLENSNTPRSQQFRQLKSYTRDSLQILTVKLVAIKLLHEKNLLERDIQENTEYYKDLLVELRASTIARADYLFLEDKVNGIITESLEQKVQDLKWFLYAGVFLIVSLSFALLQSRKPKERHYQGLSRQETTIRNLILQGKSNKEIANELFISLSTVKSHITNIYSKLNVANRQELLQKSTGTST